MNPHRVFLILAGLSFLLTLWRWVASRRFPLHQRLPASSSLPALTVLKPLKGCDVNTKHCLRSWLAQNYPGSVQILFGVAFAEDPVCAVVRELLAEFPQADAQLFVCYQNLGANGKISTLRQLEPHIRHELIIISDADVFVPPDFAANVTPLFADSEIGLVNCFYRLANPATLAMHWEAISINADFWCEVLQARSIQKIDFALGAVMALPAAQLKAFGGFATLADFLADDYQLGQQIARLGKRISFANVVVDCFEAPMSWAQVWSHQLRWARTIRVCQPVPFFFSILNNASLWPLLAILTRSPCIGIACLLFRIATALQQQRRLTESTAHFIRWWLVPIKDLLNVVIWAAAFWGSHVEWRGERYKILPGGKLQKVN